MQIERWRVQSLMDRSLRSLTATRRGARVAGWRLCSWQNAFGIECPHECGKQMESRLPLEARSPLGRG